MSLPIRHKRKLVLRKSQSEPRLPGLGQRILKRISDLAQCLRDEGVYINLDPSSYALEIFLRMSLGVQRKILTSFSSYLELCQDFRAQRQDLRDAPKLTWAFLKRNGLQPTSNLFSSFRRDDVIEIYNMDHVQIFRSLNFFDAVDVPLFDLLVLDWMCLYKRAPEIESKIFFQMKTALKKPQRTWKFEDVPGHVLHERFSADRKEYFVEMRFQTPLIRRSIKGQRPSSAALLQTSQIYPLPAVELPKVSGQ